MNSRVLSLETAFGAFFGYLFFAEGFAPRQLLGGGPIFAAIVLCQVKAVNHRRGAENAE